MSSKKRSPHELRFDVMPNSEIMSGIKRAFTRSIIVDKKYESERIEKPRYNKDGSLSKVKDVWYKCNHCQNEFKRPDLDCDHIDPVIPVEIPTRHMSWDVIIEERCFVKTLDKLQLLCQTCHIKKSKTETELRKEWRKKEKFIVYMTTCTVNGKRYIGVHKCISLDDGYIGSGNALKNAIEKHGRENFYRKVLYCYDNTKDAFDKEKELVTEEFIKSKDNYNLQVGGLGGSTKSKETLEKMSKARKGKDTPARKEGRKLRDQKRWEKGDFMSVKAINIITQEEFSFMSIKDCALKLNLNEASIYQVIRGAENRTQHKGWTFETKKYGKSKPLNNRSKCFIK